MEFALLIQYSYSLSWSGSSSTGGTVKRHSNESTRAESSKNSSIGCNSGTWYTSEMAWPAENVEQALRASKTQVVRGSQGILGHASARAMSIGKAVQFITYSEELSFAPAGEQFGYRSTGTTERAQRRREMSSPTEQRQVNSRVDAEKTDSTATAGMPKLRARRVQVAGPGIYQRRFASTKRL
jgi:hypothetical protein